MEELFMQIEIFEKDLNSTTCFDNIVIIKKDKQHFYIEDIDGWHALFLMTTNIEIKVNFYNLEEEFEL